MKEKEKDIFDKIMALPGLNIFEGFYQKYKEMLLYLFFGGMTAVISIGSYSYSLFHRALIYTYCRRSDTVNFY